MRTARALVTSVMLLLLTGFWSSPARAEVSFDFFYSNLSPHGSWEVSARYGRVWQPNVYGPDWNPYYDGHWIYADVGWTWVSDYEWGAVPYHYGTWVEDPEFGWVWVPGYVWAPSWVVFRTGPDYIGWAPVSPGFSVGVSARFGGGAVGPFVFVSARDFVAPRIRTCIVPESRASLFISQTRVVNTIVVERNVVVNRGPDVTIIERASGRRIREVPIEQVSRVAPGRQVTREQIAVDTQRGARGFRAAEPVPASRPLPRGGGAHLERTAMGRSQDRDRGHEKVRRQEKDRVQKRDRGPLDHADRQPREHPAPRASSRQVVDPRPRHEARPPEARADQQERRRNVKTPRRPHEDHPHG